MRRGERNSGGYGNNIMPSLMATSLASWRTHSARTKILHNHVRGGTQKVTKEYMEVTKRLLITINENGQKNKLLSDQNRNSLEILFYKYN